jgi:transposase
VEFKKDDPCSMVLSPFSRQLKERYCTVYYGGDIFMGKYRRTFTVDFKMQAIEMYLHRGMGSKLIGKELGVTYSVIDRWIKNYNSDGILGLQEKRGKSRQAKASSIKHSQNNKMERLEAENAYLKKLLAVKREMRSKETNQ